MANVKQSNRNRMSIKLKERRGVSVYCITVRCICLLHNSIIGLERTTHDPSVLQETSQIRGSRQARTNVSGRSFSRSSKQWRTPGILFGRVQQIQMRTEDRVNGDLGAVAL